jgi:hypothetical protein
MSTSKLNKQQMRSETRPKVRKVRGSTPAEMQVATIKEAILKDKRQNLIVTCVCVL